MLLSCKHTRVPRASHTSPDKRLSCTCSRLQYISVKVYVWKLYGLCVFIWELEIPCCMYVCRLATCVCVCLQYWSSCLSVLKRLWSNHDLDVVERTSKRQRVCFSCWEFCSCLLQFLSKPSSKRLLTVVSQSVIIVIRCVCMFACMYKHVNNRHVCLFVYNYVYTCVRMWVYICMHIYIYIYIYVYIYIYRNTHTRT
jgi:hypothetical protein